MAIDIKHDLDKVHGTSALSYWVLVLRRFPPFKSDRDTTETGKPPSTSDEKAVDTVRCWISLDVRNTVEELAMFSGIKPSVVFFYNIKVKT